ncbi:MAG: hypothetical protein JWP08_2159 [Bryobacterales bacterium]|nr:hypothetical protein [Bryobacterales bacterium]
MDASKNRVFYFHADASPIGGHFTKPKQTIVHSHGSSALAQAGGHVSSRADKFEHPDKLVSFKTAYSEIHGMVSETGSWTTEVTSVVEGLNVLDMVKADRVIASLTVEHPSNGGHPKASIVGSGFENLTIDGVKVSPVLAKKVLPPHKTAKFPDRAIVEDEDFLARAIAQSEKVTNAKGAPDWLKTRHRWVQSKGVRRRKGYVQCSLVDRIQGAKSGSFFGHVLHVPDFGNIFLGELLTSHHAFRLTMIRLEMGCANEGTMSIGTSDSNGTTSP